MLRDPDVAGGSLVLDSLDPLAGGGLSIRVLGDVEAYGARGAFAPSGARPGAILAMLVMHAGERVTADRLNDELWPSQSPVPRTKRVQVNVLRLRRGLQAAAGIDPAVVVRTRLGGYSLEIDPDAIDAVRFARHAARGRAQLDAGEAVRAAATLRGALALWRGHPYADFTYEAFAAGEIRRLEDLRTAALEDWAEAELALGSHAAVASELRRLVAQHPLHERLCALLMLALYRCRRQSEALAVYHEARAVLVDRLGIEPGSELRALQQAILEQSPALECSTRGLLATTAWSHLAQAA